MHIRGLAITDDLADPPITALSSVPDAAVDEAVRRILEAKRDYGLIR